MFTNKNLANFGSDKIILCRSQLSESNTRYFILHLSALVSVWCNLGTSVPQTMSDGGSFKLHSRPDPQSLKSEINEASDFNIDEKVLTRLFFTFPGIFLANPSRWRCSNQSNGSSHAYGVCGYLCRMRTVPRLLCLSLLYAFIVEDYLGNSFAFQRSV